MIPLLSHIERSNLWMTRYAKSQLQRVRGGAHNTEGAELLPGTIIPDHWYGMLESSKVKDRPVGIRRMGTNLVLWRDAKDKLTVALDRCPHRGSKLSQGFVLEGRIECPYHGFQFDGTGQCRLVPANPPGKRMPGGLKLTTYPSREEEGIIWVWWGEPRDEYPEVPWFPQSDEEERNSAAMSGTWGFHYSRVIENSLDAHHFPFIHGAINPKCGTIVAPFSAEDDGDLIKVTAGLKRDVADPDEEALTFHMALRMPNVMHINLAKKIHMTQIATPIDDENTWMFGRYYQSYLVAPIVGPLLSQAMLAGDWVFAQEMQDFPIFRTQQPKVPGMDSGYRLIEADKGIIMYFRRRDALIAQAAKAAAANGAAASPAPKRPARPQKQAARESVG